MNRLLDLIGGAAGWRQTDRLLTLTTPAGPDALLAETAHIDEALGPVAGHAGFRIDLTVLTADAHQSLTALQGQPARLELHTALSRTAHRPFHPSSTVRAQKRPFSRSCPRSHAGFKAIFQKVV